MMSSFISLTFCHKLYQPVAKGRELNNFFSSLQKLCFSKYIKHVQAVQIQAGQEKKPQHSSVERLQHVFAAFELK